MLPLIFQVLDQIHSVKQHQPYDLPTLSSPRFCFLPRKMVSVSPHLSPQSAIAVLQEKATEFISLRKVHPFVLEDNKKEICYRS